MRALTHRLGSLAVAGNCALYAALGADATWQAVSMVLCALFVGWWFATALHAFEKRVMAETHAAYDALTREQSRLITKYHKFFRQCKESTREN